MEDGAISRDEILSGGLTRQRRARLVLQRLLACLEAPAQAADPAPIARADPAPGADDALAVQLQELRTRSTRRQVLDGGLLLEQRARWQALIPADRALRAEVLRQLGQAVSFSADQAAELERLFAPGAEAGQSRVAAPVAAAAAPPPQAGLPLASAQAAKGRADNQPRWFAIATWPVGIKLGGLLVLFSLFPSLLVGNVGALMAQKQAEHSGERQLSGLARSVAGGLNREIAGYVELIRFVAKDPGVVAMAGAPEAQRAALAQPVLALFDRLQQSHPQAVFTYLLDRQGRCIAASDRKLIGHDYSFRTYFQRGLLQPFYVSGTYLPISTTDRSAAISITSPVRRGNDVVGVAVVATHTLAHSSALQVTSGTQAMVVEADGLISSAKDPAMRLGILGPAGAQARPIQRRVSLNARIDRGQRFRRQLSYHPVSASLLPLISASESGFGLGELDGKPMVAAWQPLETRGWTAVVMEPSANFTSPTQKVQHRVVLLASLLGLVAMLAAVAASRTLSVPLRILTAAASQLESDEPVDQTRLIRVSGRRDDLGVLATRLLEACRQARKREASLKAQVAALHIKIDHGRRDRDVAVIVESDFFNDLKAAAAELRQQRRGSHRRSSPAS
ncbi:MAG: cache domain-containing protein [Cyanobacteria bacterium]|nr:cache domain-containing protein [Cyanobacteriota bacterium]